MKKIAIKNESGSGEEGKLLIDYLISLGGNNQMNYAGDSETMCYYISYSSSITGIKQADLTSDYEITTIRELLLKGTTKSEYPKLMYVADYPITDSSTEYIRVVFMEKNNEYIAWDNATTIAESEVELTASNWKYAINYVEPKIIELSIEEIAEKLKIAPDLLRIKH